METGKRYGRYLKGHQSVDGSLRGTIRESFPVMRVARELPQFVPQEVCLSCDGCCRFKQPDSRWRPKISPEEADGRGHGGGPADDVFLKEIDGDGYVKAVRRGEQIRCVFLHGAGDNMCHVYEHRPFECRLYPFLLLRKGAGAAVGAHLSCPYVQGKRENPEYKKFVGHLQEYFQREDALGFVRRNRSLLGDYSGYEGEIKELFALAL